MRLCRFTTFGFLLCVAACADTPIAAEQVQADGTLTQEVPTAAQMVAAAVDATMHAQARPVQLASVLATASQGALQDAARFPADVGKVHLHVRADHMPDGVGEPAVVYVWSHDDTIVEVPGRLSAGTTMTLAASHPIARSQTGDWRVEIFLDRPEGRALLHARDFEVR